ncbi:hypothetical protein [Herbidospora sp. RD11066]
MRVLLYGVRILLLAILVAGALFNAATLQPAHRTIEQFRAALAAGEVDRVSFDVVRDGGPMSELRWSESPLHWRMVTDDFADGEGRYTGERLSQDLSAAPVHPELRQQPWLTVTRLLVFPTWPFAFPGGGNLWWLAAAYCVAVWLLFCSRPRLATHWAWFWMCTVGESGTLFFLLLEPNPLWRGPSEGPLHAKPISGLYGLFVSIPMLYASWGVSAGAGWVIMKLLG